MVSFANRILAIVRLTPMCQRLLSAINVLASIAAAAPFVRYSYARANEFQKSFKEERDEKVEILFVERSRGER